MKEPIHIEFYGLPGCGKSTISHIVAEQLRVHGIKIYEPSYDTDHNMNPISRKIYKLISTFRFGICNRKEYKMLRDLVVENGNTNYTLFKQIVNIIPKIEAYHKTENAIYIWDEGLVQSAISLALNSNINVERTENDLFFIAGQRKTIKMYLKADKETALLRMAKRNNNDSRVEQEPDKNKKQAMMARFEECCNQIDDAVQIECSDLSVEALCNCIISDLLEREKNGEIHYASG